MEFSRQEYWSRLPFPSPGGLPNPRTKPRSPALQADSLQSAPPGKPSLQGGAQNHVPFTPLPRTEHKRLHWGLGWKVTKDGNVMSTQCFPRDKYGGFSRPTGCLRKSPDGGFVSIQSPHPRPGAGLMLRPTFRPCSPSCHPLNSLADPSLSLNKHKSSGLLHCPRFSSFLEIPGWPKSLFKFL